jgi:hypothetical protein
MVLVEVTGGGGAYFRPDKLATLKTHGPGILCKVFNKLLQA